MSEPVVLVQERAHVPAAAWRSVARRAALPLLFAALVAVGGAIRVYLPGNPVPFTLQVMAVLLAGSFLSPRGAMASILIFLGAGAAGAPVFAGGGSGPAYLIGPTGGYLVGFLVAAPMLAALRRRGSRTFGATVLNMAAAVAVIHALGVMSSGLLLGSFAAAFAATAQFFPMDLVKIAAAAGFVSGCSSLRARQTGRG